MLLASAIPFVTGLPYLAVALGQLGAPNDVQSVLAAGLYPFIIGGVAKALIAAGILPLAWKAVGRR
ncbi:biotin transporter BioY [Curtobacterium flaccumfaciens]|nr:biotin transporter BioY [Curtobacterium flaccumfaciens]